VTKAIDRWENEDGALLRVTRRDTPADNRLLRCEAVGHRRLPAAIVLGKPCSGVIKTNPRDFACLRETRSAAQGPPHASGSAEDDVTSAHHRQLISKSQPVHAAVRPEIERQPRHRSTV
jgi:hypothetical protein